MEVWDKKTLFGFVFLLAGAVGQSVNYTDPVCAVRGSTVTVLCSFTPLRSIFYNGKEVPSEIIRVRWCQNHLICQGTTPSVYDSDPKNNNKNDPRYKYLGDKKGNCTLQITDVQRKDEATLRFRMEGNIDKAHFTGQSGVSLTVTETPQMKISSSSRATKLTAGGDVTLYCTAPCTFRQLEVTWLKDDHALSESGPALQLCSLTAGDSGNYTCSLRTISGTHSLPYSLQVEAEQKGAGVDVYLLVGVASGVLLVVLILVAVACIIKRKRTADQRPATGDFKLKHPDSIYSNILPPTEPDGGGQQGGSSLAVDDVNYSSVQFKDRDRARPVMEAEEAIIYSAVVSRS